MKHEIPIGMLVPGRSCTQSTVKSLVQDGFESISLHFWQSLGEVSLERLAGNIMPILKDAGIVVSALSIYGNPLMQDSDGRESRFAWKELVDCADAFECSLVTGFTGRIPGTRIEDSLDPLQEVFVLLLEKASENNLRIAFENCRMGGDWKRGGWNVAHSPESWELLFRVLDFPHLGLEWEPCHQLLCLIDPIPQLSAWIDRIFHIHGKDASIDYEAVRMHGVYGKRKFASHRVPGTGDTDWTEVFSVLFSRGYRGTVDIEVAQDPVYHDEREYEGYRRALAYLKHCRASALSAGNIN